MNLKVRASAGDYWEKKLFLVRILEDRTESWTSHWFPSLKDLPERFPEETKNRKEINSHDINWDVTWSCLCMKLGSTSVTVVHISQYVCFAPTSLRSVFFFKGLLLLSSSFFLRFIYLLIYFFPHWVFVAVCGLSLVAVHGLLIAVGSLVLWSRGYRHMGFNSCGSWL